LSEESNKIELRCIWQDPKENSVSRNCITVKERCSDIERYRMILNLYANMREKRSLIFYCEEKLEWVKEEYTVCCVTNERSGLSRFKTGI
jgi:hypothetical protein